MANDHEAPAALQSLTQGFSAKHLIGGESLSSAIPDLQDISAKHDGAVVYGIWTPESSIDSPSNGSVAIEVIASRQIRARAKYLGHLTRAEVYPVVAAATPKYGQELSLNGTFIKWLYNSRTPDTPHRLKMILDKRSIAVLRSEVTAIGAALAVKAETTFDELNLNTWPSTVEIARAAPHFPEEAMTEMQQCLEEADIFELIASPLRLLPIIY